MNNQILTELAIGLLSPMQILQLVENPTTPHDLRLYVSKRYGCEIMAAHLAREAVLLEHEQLLRDLRIESH